ncbi:hypothetical protein E2C01_014348 [Portunus trituberculatus]|uniref:Uncharacterized protein n=1 Tax=Portunus trituberculatus TaxID=210409 RepID=A0A5B7DJN1_PORTR|nr:hypothetical protein [Portunus trituberculatus]
MSKLSRVSPSRHGFDPRALAGRRLGKLFRLFTPRRQRCPSSPTGGCVGHLDHENLVAEMVRRMNEDVAEVWRGGSGEGGRPQIPAQAYPSLCGKALAGHEERRQEEERKGIVLCATDGLINYATAFQTFSSQAGRVRRLPAPHASQGRATHPFNISSFVEAERDTACVV